MRSCRSICTRTKCSAAPGWSRPGPISRILGGTMLAGVLVVATRRQLPRRMGRARRLLVAVLGYVAGRQVPPAPPAADAPPLRWTGTSSAPRSRWSARRCTSRGCSWRSSRSASSGRSARCSIRIFPPLVKNVLGADEQVASLFLAHLLGRRRDRLGRDQPAAQGRGLGALRAGLGDRDGRCSCSSSTAASHGWPASTAPELRDARQFPRHARAAGLIDRSPCSASRSPAACSWCRSTPS